jgi:hypothetical protein
VDDREVVLEQYKEMLSLTRSGVELREKLDRFYVTVNGALLAASVSLLDRIEEDELVVVLFAIGCALCVAWFMRITEYRLSTHHRWLQVEALEALLPVQPIRDSWREYRDARESAMPRGARWTREASRITPLVFFLAHGLAGTAVFLGFV